MRLLWEDRAWDDYLYWQTQDKKTLKRINALVKDIQNIPFDGIGEAFKKALFEKIEDEYDIAIADEAYAEYVKGGKKSKPIAEL